MFDSIKQKIEVISCFALSRVFYVATVIPVTSKFRKSVNQIIGDFIWSRSGKVLKIPMDLIINGERRGGLGLLSLETMSKSLIILRSRLYHLIK